MNRYSHIFDSHAHYDDPAFDGDRGKLLSELPSLGVYRVVDCGSNIASSEKAAALAAKYPYFYFAAGIHPEEARNLPDDWENCIRSLLKKPKAVAVGEIGLDYHFRENPPREVQKDIFVRQILLAESLGLPVIVHDREAHGDTMDILSKYRPRGVVHCFSGSVEMAREVLGIGMYIGLGGSVTFKNARVPVEVAKMVPPDRILLETDCPYMAPVPFRGKRNDSSLIACTANRAAEIRGEDTQEFIDKACQNAERLFLGGQHTEKI
ncbi:MAG TPA: hydrolase TatD [Ruminococcaceae bacterium]|jgi:TatD DNase family protein|nr:hydrolase TatD [Oscillospiraceae bacterium]